MPTVTMHFPAYDPAIWNKPWLAHVGTWPDTGPAQLTFAKGGTGDATGYALALDLPAGEVVRWGQKALQPGATGVHATQSMGWGLVGANGIVPISADQAKTHRRNAHPEDATAAPIVFGKGKGTKGKARKLRPDQVAAIAAKGAAPAQAAPVAPAAVQVAPGRTTTHELLAQTYSADELAKALLAKLGCDPTDANAMQALMQSVEAWELDRGAAPAPAAPPPQPKAPPAPMAAPDPASMVPQVDADGFPLF